MLLVIIIITYQYFSNKDAILRISLHLEASITFDQHNMPRAVTARNGIHGVCYKYANNELKYLEKDYFRFSDLSLNMIST